MCCGNCCDNEIDARDSRKYEQEAEKLGYQLEDAEEKEKQFKEKVRKLPHDKTCFNVYAGCVCIKDNL